ncbi:MAG: hypothetical protein RL462_66 [Pseudomonadota bacterium]|jgi:hypothetical protein
MTIYWVIAYFLVLALTLIYKTPIIRGPWLFLLRSFFPNWKFFHAVGYVPHLYARAANLNANGDAIWTEWVHLYPRTRQSLGQLFHNPITNLALAQQNLIDHFWADLNDAPDGCDPRGFVSYQMVAHFVAGVLKAQFPEHSHHQFELRMLLDNSSETVHSHVMMTSPMEPRT